MLFYGAIGGVGEGTLISYCYMLLLTCARRDNLVEWIRPKKTRNTSQMRGGRSQIGGPIDDDNYPSNHRPEQQSELDAILECVEFCFCAIMSL